MLTAAFYMGRHRVRSDEGGFAAAAFKSAPFCPFFLWHSGVKRLARRQSGVCPVFILTVRYGLRRR